MLDSCLEQLTLLAAMGERNETETERIEMLTKRMMETPSPAPPLVEPPLAASADRTSAKRRRRTRYTPLPGIWNTQCTWLRVRGRLYGTLDFERARDCSHTFYNELGAATDDHPVVLTEALPNPMAN